MQNVLADNSNRPPSGRIRLKRVFGILIIALLVLQANGRVTWAKPGDARVDPLVFRRIRCVASALDSISAAGFAAQEGRVHFEGAKPDEAQVQGLSSLLRSMQLKLAGGRLRLPDSIRIRVLERQEEKVESLDEWLANVYTSLAEEYVKPKSACYKVNTQEAVVFRDKAGNLNPAIVAHEVGHGVFIERLAQISERWREGLKHYKTWLDGLAHSIHDEQAAKAAFKRTPEVEAYMTLNKLSMPYQELIADCLAVIELDDGQAIYKTMEEPESSAELYSLKVASNNARDFTQRQRVAEIQKLHDAIMGGVGLLEAHIALGTVRHFLWREYFSKAKSSEEKVRILNAVFDACTLELGRRIRESASGTSTMDLGILNRRLITKIKQELSESSRVER